MERSETEVMIEENERKNLLHWLRNIAYDDDLAFDILKAIYDAYQKRMFYKETRGHTDHCSCESSDPMKCTVHGIPF